MAKPRVIVLRAPGTNCDMETVFAFETAGAQTELIHINRLLETPTLLSDFQILCLQGGFSYGDDIAAGSILGGQLQNHLQDTLRSFHDGDRLMLGICNGFQVMMRAGLLIPNDPDGPIATLAWNASGRYEDRWVHLAANGSKCVFLSGIDSIYLPVAHAEGRFVCRSSDDFARLADSGQLVLKYANADSKQKSVGFPANPNGSMGDVAGICDATGRAFGLMPHPERFLNPTQHPTWTRLNPLPDSGQGLKIFENAVRYFE